MRERDIETYLTKKVEALGGLSLKFVSPGVVGVPDQVVMLPQRPAFFVELKARGGHLSPSQVRRQSDIEATGTHCYTAFSTGEVDKILEIECPR